MINGRIDMSHLKRLLSEYGNMSITLKSGIWFTLCNFVQKGISFITIPIFTRIMTTQEYGSYSVYTSWYSLIAIFATLNLSNFVFNKGMVKYPEDRDNFELSMFSLSSTITLILFGVYFIFRYSINLKLDLTTPLMICMFIQILTEPSVLYWTVRNRFEYKYKSVVLITLSIAVLNPIIGICLIKAEVFNNAVLSRALSSTVVSSIFALLIFLKLIEKNGRLFSTKYWKYALTFNIPLIPHFLSQMVLNQADRIMIKDICNASDAAIYSVAYSVGMAVLLFSQAIQQTYLPWLYQNLANKKYEKIPYVGNVFIVALAGINILVISFTPEIISIVGPETYRAAIWVMPPVCGSVYFIFLQNLFANVEYYFEQTKLIALVSVIVAVDNIILNAIFIPIFGFVAAGYTTLVCYIIHAILHYMVMHVACKKNHLSIENIFSIKVVLLTSVVFCLLLVVITISYKWKILRYGLIIVFFIVALLFSNRTVSTVKEIKNN